MPYNSELERKYSLTLSELYDLANRIIVAMHRDIADFAQFKILPENLTALEALTVEYYDNLNDDMYKAEHSYAIQLRNELRETIQHYLKRLALAAKNVFKNAPSIYNALVLPNVAKLTDKVFVVDISNVYKNAVQNKTKLEAEGIDTNYLTNFETKIDEFNAAMRTVEETLNQRETKTEQRIKLANTLHDTLSKYCDYGKFLYEDVSPAKYNDYLMTPVQPGALKSPTNLIYHIKETTLTWDIVLHATSYVVEYSQDGEHFTEVYSGAEAFCIFTPPVEGWGYYKVRGRNSAGYGPYSTVLKQGYYAILPPPSNVTAERLPNTNDKVKIKWDEVPSATKYALYISTVPLGSPANTYIFVNREPRTMEEMTLEIGKRHWFEVTAESNVQWSNRSNAVYIDL